MARRIPKYVHAARQRAARNMKVERVRLGFNQGQVADLIGVPRATYAGMEQGVKPFTPEFLAYCQKADFHFEVPDEARTRFDGKGNSAIQVRNLKEYTSEMTPAKRVATREAITHKMMEKALQDKEKAEARVAKAAARKQAAATKSLTVKEFQEKKEAVKESAKTACPTVQQQTVAAIAIIIGGDEPVRMQPAQWEAFWWMTGKIAELATARN